MVPPLTVNQVLNDSVGSSPTRPTRGFGNFLYDLIIAHLELKREIFGGRIQKGNNVCRVGKRKTPLCVVEILYELMRR